MKETRLTLVEREIARELDRWHHRTFVSLGDLCHGTGRPTVQVRNKAFGMVSRGLVDCGLMGGYRLTSKGRSVFRSYNQGEV